MMKLLKTRRKRNEEGFSLAELTVGIGVGAVIFSMAIAFLVTFASTSFQANAKSEVSGSARLALTNVLKQVSSAASLPECAQWKNKTIAEQVRANRALYNTISNKKNNCIELVNGSQSLLRAESYQLCWYKTTELNSSSGVVFPDRVACIFTGGNGSLCKAGSQTDPDMLYISECAAGTPSSPISGTSKIVTELGLHKSAGGAGRAPIRTPIFTYINYDSSTFATNTDKVLKVSVNAEVSYENGRFVAGEKDYSVYRFASTIQLSGMRAFLESGAYGN